MKDDMNFFGVPEENIAAAQHHAAGKKNPSHIVVPTKKDIETQSLPQLRTTLVDWMEHSAIEIIPSRGQIVLVREVLLNRDDSEALVPVIAMCTNYIEGA